MEKEQNGKLFIKVAPPWIDIETQILPRIEQQVSSFNRNERSSGRRIMIKALKAPLIHLIMLIDPTDRFNLSPIKFRAFGIDKNKFIRIDIKLRCDHPLIYNNLDLDLVTVDSYQCGDVTMKKHGLNEKHFFPLSRLIEGKTKEALLRRLIPYLFDDNADTSANSFEDLCDLIEDTVKRADHLCIVSGERIDRMFRPRMKNSYSYFGQAFTSKFGEKLVAWYIQNERHLVEYLIKSTQGYGEYTSCYYQKPKFSIPQPDGSLSYYNFDKCIGIWEAFNALPPVDTLAKYCEDGELKSKLIEIEPASFSVLLWLLLTNPVYLHPTVVYNTIKDNVKQYILLCSSKSVEKHFQQDKQSNKCSQYGIAEIPAIANRPYLTGPCIGHNQGRSYCHFMTNVHSWSVQLSSMTNTQGLYALVAEHNGSTVLSQHFVPTFRRTQPRVLLHLESADSSEIITLKLQDTSSLNYMDYLL